MDWLKQIVDRAKKSVEEDEYTSGLNELNSFAQNTPSDNPPRTAGGTLKDVGITALKGAIGLPEAAVGIADIATGQISGLGASGYLFALDALAQLIA